MKADNNNKLQQIKLIAQKKSQGFMLTYVEKIMLSKKVSRDEAKLIRNSWK